MNAKTQFWASKEAYLAFKKQWAKLAQEKKISSRDILFYNIVRGKKMRNGFTPITKEVKLNNGAKPEQAFEWATYSLRYLLKPPHKYAQESLNKFIESFEGTIDAQFIARLDEFLNGEAEWKQGRLT